MIIKHQVDGVIVSNTTIGLREQLHNSSAHESGGLSGKPLYEKTNDMISFISRKTNGKLPIIGVGGIMTPKQAIKKIEAGAHLIQLYTGIIYEGPGIANQINKELLNQEF